MILGEKIYSQYLEYINKSLKDVFQKYEGHVSEAMRYAVLNGGKRIRPVLTLSVCEAFGGNKETALPFALATELIHSSSLIFDDMPCMDDDDLRRGLPATHVKYGESTAVLAGIGMNMIAIQLITDSSKADPLISDRMALDAASVLLRASSMDGIVYGQELDLLNVNNAELSIEQIKEINKYKTGAMFSAAVRLGCIAANVSKAASDKMNDFAEYLGLSFQIRDDILDMTKTREELGKTPLKDSDTNKKTYATIYGVEKAKEILNDYIDKCYSILNEFPNTDFIKYLVDLLRI